MPTKRLLRGVHNNIFLRNRFNRFNELKTKFFLFLILSIFINQSLFSQNIPDYKERSFASLTDSAMTQNYMVEATEGSINPNEYIVGPGDKLFISIIGVQDFSINLMINQEGFLFIPKVGGIDLRNTTLAASKEKIISLINKYYKNVDVFISLIDFRKIKVSLLGDVKKPSSYVLPGNSRLIDLITNSYGLSPTSNYRNIKVVSNDSTSKVYDFLKYLRFGDSNNDPMLREGDVVIVDKVDKVISIKGEVKYPGVYEFVRGESVSDFIKLAGGFLSKAKTDTIEVVKFDPEGKNQKSYYYTYNRLKDKNILLDNQDMVLVRQVPQYFIDRFVKIGGWVKYPGYYKIIEDKTTLEEVINEAGGFLKDASLVDASLYRNLGTVENDPEYDRLKEMQRKDMTDDEYDYFKAKSRQRKGKVVVDFVALFKNHDESENVVLKNGDVINVPEAKNYIIMLGQVINPGDIIYQKNLKVEDYIRIAGGYGWRAETGDVRVIRANSGEWVYANKVDQLYPGDAIWVPEEPPAPKFWDVFTTSLQIVGQLASIVAATVAVIIASRK
ncbi:MAG: SLBB domain-containing protein [Bacteroidetes bacterium]|nr:SLBB domain-containing protein [Bacteroidota bacterium]